MKENYSAILITYNDGGRHAYVAPTPKAKRDGLYDGGKLRGEDGSYVCENFERLYQACERIEEFLKGE